MSVAPDTNTAHRLISLCKEYAQVLTTVRMEAKSLAKTFADSSSSDSPVLQKKIAIQELAALQSGYNLLRSGVQELIRAVSQRLEHSGLDFEDHLELRIRLADLEGKLGQTDVILRMGLPT